MIFGEETQKKEVNKLSVNKRERATSKISVDNISGSLAYNRFEMQVSQTLHMAIELFDSLDYLFVLDYYDDITLFESANNPEFVSYYQMKTNEESISISTAISEDWIGKLYEQLENPEWIVKELGLITNCPLKISFKKKDVNGKDKRQKKLFTSEKTSFSKFNEETIDKIKKDIATKKGVKPEDVDLSKFVHMRTILSIPSHKEIVEKEMGDFLHNKYPKITIDSVKTIYATMMGLLTKRQQYELLSENASFYEVKKYKGVSKNDFARIIDEAMIISIPQFNEIMSVLKLSENEKFKASFEYTKIMTDSQMKTTSFISVFEKVKKMVKEKSINEEELAWEYANRLCDVLYKNNSTVKIIYNRLYICVLVICILINEMRKL